MKKMRYSISSLPDDIIIEILSRMSVKTLVRFRCLSKYWSAIIRSPDFVSKHLHQSKLKHPKLSLLLSCHGEFNDEDRYGVCLLAGETVFSDQDFPLKMGKIGEEQRRLTTIVGCSNGLVCISSLNDGVKTIVWNPATRQHRLLPSPLIYPTTTNDGHYVGLGFGFHHEINDYKLVRIVQRLRQKDIKVEAFTLSRGLWREIVVDDPPACRFSHKAILPARRSVVVNGIWHQIAVENRKEFILSFDMRHQVFQKTKLPPCVLDHSKGLLVSRDSLAMGVFVRMRYLDLWIMENGSWMDLFIRIPACGNMRHIGISNDIDVMWIFGGREYKKRHENKSGFYDPLNVTFKFVSGSIKPQYILEAHAYAESLVSV